MRRLTLARKKALIEQTKDMTPTERLCYLGEWGIGEEEFQVMLRRFKEYGLMGIKNQSLPAIRRKESLAVN